MEKSRKKYKEYYAELLEALYTSPEDFEGLLADAMERGFPAGFRDDGGYTLLHHAATIENAVPALTALIGCGAPIDGRWHDDAGESGTALHLCLYCLRFQNFAYLASSGADIEAEDDCGLTPLTLDFVLYVKFGIDDYLRWGILMIGAGFDLEGLRKLNFIPSSKQELHRLELFREAAESYIKERLLLSAFNDG